MKVVHISKADGGGGGSQQFAFDLSTTGDSAGLIVQTKVTSNTKVVELPNSTIDRIFDFVNALLKRVGISRTLRNLLFLNDELNRTCHKLNSLKIYKEAEIIHLHNIHGGYFDLRALDSIAKQKKIVWTLHDMWALTGGEIHTFEHEGYRTGDAHTPYCSLYPLNRPLIDRRKYFLQLKKRIYERNRKSILFVPVSYWLEGKIRNAYVWNRDMKIKTIQNGVDVAKFRILKERKWSRPKILFFNSTNAFKGSSIFLEVLKRVNNDADLIVVGNQEKVINEHFSNPQYFNFIEERDELVDLYNSVDILVFPSVADNLPLTLLEAMACGVCVLASNVGGIPEIVSNHSVGDLFNIKNTSELAPKLNNLIADLDATREKGKQASQHVRETFDSSNVALKYKELYSEI